MLNTLAYALHHTFAFNTHPYALKAPAALDTCVYAFNTHVHTLDNSRLHAQAKCSRPRASTRTWGNMSMRAGAWNSREGVPVVQVQRTGGGGMGYWSRARGAAGFSPSNA